MIGLDTTAIIDLFNGEAGIIEKISDVKESLVSTIINYQEVFFGIDLEGHRFIEEEDYFDNFFNNVEVLELTKIAAKRASNISWKLKSSGKEIDDFDCMIAGILLSNGVDKIITRNVKHFNGIQGLKVIAY
jgi:predicted nucleic acid-binding protein